MKKTLLITGISSILLTACVTDPYTGQSTISNTAKGGGLGAVAGAALGTAFGGNDLKNAGFGALAGGAVGGPSEPIWIISKNKWNSRYREPVSKFREHRKTR